MWPGDADQLEVPWLQERHTKGFDTLAYFIAGHMYHARSLATLDLSMAKGLRGSLKHRKVPLAEYVLPKMRCLGQEDT